MPITPNTDTRGYHQECTDGSSLPWESDGSKKAKKKGSSQERDMQSPEKIQEMERGIDDGSMKAVADGLLGVNKAADDHTQPEK